LVTPAPAQIPLAKLIACATPAALQVGWPLLPTAVMQQEICEMKFVLEQMQLASRPQFAGRSEVTQACCEE